MVSREALARANIEAAIKEAGFDWTVELQRKDGYTLTMRKGARRFIRSALDEAVLEDAWSAERSRLIQDASLELEAP